MKPLLFVASLFAFGLSSPVWAQDAPAVTVELNKTDTIGESCRLTFVLRNTHERAVDKMIAETVLFSDAQEVVLLTLFDFGELPAGSARVRQFQVPDTSCDRLGTVLLNGVDTCAVDGAASDICAGSLSLSSRSKIALEG